MPTFNETTCLFHFHYFGSLALVFDPSILNGLTPFGLGPLALSRKIHAIYTIDKP